MKEIFNVNKENKVITCTLKYQNQNFEGIATCHQDDIDMFSEKTGCTIAEYRALIKLLTAKKANLQSQHKVLQHIKTNLEQYFQNKSKDYSYYQVCKQLKFLHQSLAEIKVEIQSLKEKLSTFIERKEKVYQQIRIMRKHVPVMGKSDYPS